jgi:hypothetical protein
MAQQSTRDFLSTLRQRGVKFWVESGQLRYQAPRGTLSPDDLNNLRDLKGSIINLVQSEFAIEVPIQPRMSGCQIPLAAYQLHFWKYFNSRSPGMSDRRSYVATRITGPLNVGLLQRCLAEVVSRHESLRTRIVVIDGNPTQQIDTGHETRLELVDLSEVRPPTAAREVMRRGEEFIRVPVDLAVGPLFAAKLFRLPDEHVLILASSQLLSDGYSNTVLASEIWTLYQQGAQGLPLSLPSLPLQFADYAVWLDRTYSARLKMHEKHWKGRLTGAPEIRLPRDDGMVETKDPFCATLTIPFGNELSTGLRNLARREGTLLPLVVLTAYIAVMSRWCTCRDLVVVFVSNGRSRPELRSTIGLVTSILFLRINVAKEDSFLTLLKRIESEFSSAYQHQDFDCVQQLIIPDRVAGVAFNWLPAGCAWSGSADLELKVNDELEIQPFPLDLTWEYYEFTPWFHSTAAGVSVTVGYRPDFFSSSTVEWFGNSLRSFAEEFAHDPLAPIAPLPMMPK